MVIDTTKARKLAWTNTNYWFCLWWLWWRGHLMGFRPLLPRGTVCGLVCWLGRGLFIADDAIPRFFSRRLGRIQSTSTATAETN